MTKTAAAASTSLITVLGVRLGADLHAIPIEAVEEVLPALPIESIAQCPPFVRGVVFVRGHLIPVLAAAERLELTSYERPLEPNIVCLRVNERLVGVEFDEAIDLMELPMAGLLSAEGFTSGHGFLKGLVEVNGQIIRLLDPQKLIAPQEAAKLSQIS